MPVNTRGGLSGGYLDFSFHDSQQVQQLLLGQIGQLLRPAGPIQISLHWSTKAPLLVLFLLRDLEPLLHQLGRVVLSLSHEPFTGLVASIIWTFHGAVPGTHRP